MPKKSQSMCRNLFTELCRFYVTKYWFHLESKHSSQLSSTIIQKNLQNQFLWFVALKADCWAEDADDTEDAAMEQWGGSRALSCQLGYGWWCCWPCQNDTQGTKRRDRPPRPPHRPFPLWGFCSSASTCFHLHSRASALWPPSLPLAVAQQSQLGSRLIQHFNVLK